MEYVFQYLQESMNREYRAKVLKKQAELNALQSQINPHFLYNTLESIRGEALIEGMDEIADRTEDVYKRQMLQGGGTLEGTYVQVDEGTFSIEFANSESELVYSALFTDVGGTPVMMLFPDNTGLNAIYFTQSSEE